jgi:hypothetical protein
MGKHKAFFPLILKDSAMYEAFVLHPSCVPEKGGINQICCFNKQWIKVGVRDIHTRDGMLLLYV